MDLGRIGFVLPGGGARCAIQAGCLKALDEKGISADIIQGTSGGAINAARYVESGSDALVADWLELEGRGYHTIFSRTKLLANSLRGTSLYGDKGLNEVIGKLKDISKIFNSATRLEIVVRKKLTYGPLVITNRAFEDTEENYEIFRKFVKASASFPGLFSPEKINGGTYSDGYSCALDSFAECDTVFFVDTGLPHDPLDYESLWWGHQIMDAFTAFINEEIEEEIRMFIKTYKFKLFPEEGNPEQPLWKNIIAFFKNLPKEVTRIADGLPSKRFVTIAPSINIPTLKLDKWNKGDRNNPGDLSAIIKHGYERTMEILEKL